MQDRPMFCLPCSALVMLMRCAGDAPKFCTTFCTKYHAGATCLRVGGGRLKPFSLRCGCQSGAASAHMETQTQRHTRHSGGDTDTERDAEPETYRQRHTRHTPSQSSPIASSQTQRHRDTETQRHRDTERHPKTKIPRPRSINCAGGAKLLTQTCGVALTGSGCGLS